MILASSTGWVVLACIAFFIFLVFGAVFDR